jgi:hypothetical protein
VEKIVNRSNVNKCPSVSVINPEVKIMSFSKKIVNLMEKEVSKKVGEYMMMYFQWNREKFNDSQESEETKMEELDRVKMEAFIAEFMKEHPFVLEEEKKMGRPRAKKETIVQVSGELSDITDGVVTTGDKPPKEPKVKVVKEKKEKPPKEPKVKVVKEKKEKVAKEPKPPKEPKVKVEKEKKEKPVKEKKEKVVKEKKEKVAKEPKVKVEKEKKEKPVKEKKEKAPKEKKMTKKEEKEALKAAAEAVMKSVMETVEDEFAEFATQSPSSCNGNGNGDEEQEEEYEGSPEEQEMNSLLEEVSQLNDTLEEALKSGKEGGKTRDPFVHEGEDYYVDLEMTIEDDGKTYNPIKKASTGAIVGRASGKTKEMFQEDDEDEEEEEEDEDDEDDEDD